MPVLQRPSGPGAASLFCLPGAVFIADVLSLHVSGRRVVMCLSSLGWASQSKHMGLTEWTCPEVLTPELEGVAGRALTASLGVQGSSVHEKSVQARGAGPVR